MKLGRFRFVLSRPREYLERTVTLMEVLGWLFLIAFLGACYLAIQALFSL